MTGNTVFQRMSDGQKVAVHRWMPNGAPRGIILVSHGVGEYAMRYDRFAEAATARDFAVIAPDHRGHGETAGSLSKLGYLADGDGFSRVTEDLHEILAETKREFPSIPVFLFGHSFGSIVGQGYVERYGETLSGCVLSGTIGPDPARVFFGKILANLIASIRGRKKISPFLVQLAMGKNLERVIDPASPSSWLTRDVAEVEKYDASPWAGFMSTAGFYQDLTNGLSAIHTQKEIDSIPKRLPILFIYGTDDPVGSYGKTIGRLVELYKRASIVDVTVIPYEGARHEVLNETNRDEVTADVLAWITARVSR
jgi:alpha-beta hydrolase superfamily lysophospholipase